ncbi:MAG: ABC transporter ATP-binding protein [Candidatus Nanopelagicales bacterium]|nr:ABC transporter ATP-binding protein [Candidatus Nanopelagicales bacterium]
MSVAVSVANLRKTYGDVVAVDDVSLTITTGECFAILGPNGAGKTTTVEILEGYRSRDSGEVSVLGVDPAHGGRSWRAQLGIVLQSARDLGDITTHEAVAHFATYYPAPADVDTTIASVGLTDKAAARISTLSGGQRRRVDVALGLIGAPQLLFLDEPTTGFDPQARREFWVLLQQIKAGGTTIMLTTHYLDEAEALADRVAVIAAGRVIALDTPDQIGVGEDDSVEVSWRQDGRMHREFTTSPTSFVGELAAVLGGEIPELVIRRSTLEDRYLALIDQAQSSTS